MPMPANNQTMLTADYSAGVYQGGEQAVRGTAASAQQAFAEAINNPQA